MIPFLYCVCHLFLFWLGDTDVLIGFLTGILYIEIITILPVLLDFSLTVKAATKLFISGRGLAISSAKEGKSDSIYNLVKSK